MWISGHRARHQPAAVLSPGTHSIQSQACGCRQHTSSRPRTRWRPLRNSGCTAARDRGAGDITVRLEQRPKGRIVEGKSVGEGLRRTQAYETKLTEKQFAAARELFWSILGLVYGAHFRYTRAGRSGHLEHAETDLRVRAAYPLPTGENPPHRNRADACG